ncbi:MAG: type II toxin-antitoxin system PemK/MazF family toxin [Candidatus Aenigmarchaeota archaeon]|nr:type II toxin-antitoxin system PemK/MazF family toxin [Candidatus Aenigmarchaeota archaeon]
MVSQRDIVLLSFPFSDMKTSKVRPVIVLSNNNYNSKFDDIIVVPMTTNIQIREHTLLITNKDLETGRLITDSKVKVDRIFSISKSLIKLKIGEIKIETFNKIRHIIYKLIE